MRIYCCFLVALSSLVVACASVNGPHARRSFNGFHKVRRQLLGSIIDREFSRSPAL